MRVLATLFALVLIAIEILGITPRELPEWGQKLFVGRPFG